MSSHIYSIKNILYSVLFIPSYNYKGQLYPPLIQGWTLAYEMFFYVCLGLTSALCFRRRLPVLVAGFSILVLIGIAWPSKTAAWVTYTDPILFEFLMGCAVAELLHRGKLRFGPITAGLLVAIGAIALATDFFADSPKTLRALYWGVPAFMVVLGIVRAEAFFDFGKLRIGNAIGDSSYSLYLTHSLVLSALAVVFKFGLTGPAGAGVFACGMFLVCLSVGWLCWRYVERPATTYLNRTGKTPGRAKRPKAAA